MDEDLRSLASAASSSWRSHASSAATSTARASLDSGMASSTWSSTARTTATADAMSVAALTQLAESHWLRWHCYVVVQAGSFNYCILAVILLNTVLLAVQSTPGVNMNYGWYLGLLDQAFLGVYLMEMLVKLYVFRLVYFKSGWNLFDFAIVVTSIAVFLLPVVADAAISFNPKIIRLLRVFRAFRAMRSLRALRAISFLKSLQVIVEALLASVPAMSSIIALTALILYIFAVIGRVLYSKVDPHHFGTLARSMFWMFSLTTQDSWSDIWRKNKAQAPEIFFFLFFFLVIETYVFLNLFVAVIVSNLDAANRKMDRLRRNDLRDDRNAAAAAEAATAAPESSRASLASPSSSNLFIHSVDAFPLPGFAAGINDIDTVYPPAHSIAWKCATTTYFQSLARLDCDMAGMAVPVNVLERMVDALPRPEKAPGEDPDALDEPPPLSHAGAMGAGGRRPGSARTMGTSARRSAGMQTPQGRPPP
ncbi:Cation channel sperm-associated protein 1 [Allomyces arbusculus]|nr:Cation channel sperm-associated protein 1 [Allomyces arbusculus]